MNKASPIEMRKCLQAVELLKEIGIAFVPVPYETKEEREELIDFSADMFAMIIDRSDE